MQFKLLHDQFCAKKTPVKDINFDHLSHVFESSDGPFLDSHPQTSNISIKQYISQHIEKTGISRSQLVIRLGFWNINKGLRRLELLENEGKLIGLTIEDLASALSVDVDVIRELIDQANSAAFQKQNEEYRRQFVPHAVLITTNKIPSPIFVAALIGVEKLLRLDLDVSQSPITYPKQVLFKLPVGVPAFGKVTGFIVNYTPDHAVEFNRAGKPIAAFDHAIRIGTARLKPKLPTPPEINMENE
jgi:hypothetical protein